MTMVVEGVIDKTNFEIGLNDFECVFGQTLNSMLR